MTFNRIIDRRAKKELDKNGSIQTHNGKVVRNFENMISYSLQSAWDDEFYRKLQKAVAKNELSRYPLVSSIIFVAFSILFTFACFSFRLSLSQNIIFLLIPDSMFFLFTYRIIKECSKLYTIKKSLNIKENIYSVSLIIDGTCSYTDDSDDSVKKYYYICSEPMLICAPKRIYDLAGFGKNLVGAVVKTGKHNYFYALNVV